MLWLGSLSAWRSRSASLATADSRRRRRPVSKSTSGSRRRAVRRDAATATCSTRRRQHFDARRKAIAAIKTPEDIARRQKELRAFFLGSLGDLPERTPLNPAGRRDAQARRLPRREGHLREPARSPRHGQSLPARRQAAVPGRARCRAATATTARRTKTYQRVCILLAKNGMAVLCYDPIGQGERFQLLDAEGKPVVRGTTEHTMAGIGALLVGRQLASYRIWDGFRALDYLASRPEVDPNRLGCTGNSGGGTMTAYLMALDDRIAVAAPSCYITSLERLFATIGPQDAEQNITGQVAAGMEHADYVTMRAPKPTLLTVGTRDFFDIQGSWDTFREVKLIYGRLGFGERVDLFESDEEHGFTRPRRVATARWMRRWLLKQDDAVDEPDFPIATDAELQCTAHRPGAHATSRTCRCLTSIASGSGNCEQRATRPTQIGRLMPFRAEVKKRLGLGNWEAKRVPATCISRDRPTSDELAFEVEPGTRFFPRSSSDTIASAARSGPTVVKVGADWDEELAPGKASEQLRGSHGRIVLVDPAAWVRRAQRRPARISGDHRSAATGKRPTSRSTWTGRCSASGWPTS